MVDNRHFEIANFDEIWHTEDKDGSHFTKIESFEIQDGGRLPFSK